MTTRRTLAILSALLFAPTIAAARPAEPKAETPPAPQIAPLGSTGAPAPFPDEPPVVGVTTVGVTPSPAPPSDLVDDPWDVPVFATGAIVFSGTYIASIVVADTNGHQGNHHLYVPLAGPWLDLADRGPCPANLSCSDETTAKVLLVADGVAQAAGVITMIYGIATPTYHARVANHDVDMRLQPTTVKGNAGLAVLGHF